MSDSIPTPMAPPAMPEAPNMQEMAPSSVVVPAGPTGAPPQMPAMGLGAITPPPATSQQAPQTPQTPQAPQEQAPVQTSPQEQLTQAAPSTQPAPPAAQAAPSIPAAPPMQTAPAAPPMQVAPAAPAPVTQTPVAQVPAQPPAAPQEQALAPAQQTAVAQYDANGWPVSTTVKGTLEALGFQGMDMDSFGIVPLIRLDKTEFLLGDQILPDPFEVQILSSRPKYLYSYGDRSNKNAPSGLFYSFDQETNANNPAHTLAEFKAEAAQVGMAVEVKLYHEVDCILMSTGEPVKLSVPNQGSGTQLKRFIMHCVSQLKHPKDAIVEVTKGAKVTTVQNPYYPWDFIIKGWRN